MRLMAVCKPDKKKLCTMALLFFAGCFLLFVFSSPTVPKLEQKDYLLAADSPAFGQEKVAYLTFDDGPSSVTGELLDILKEKGVPATFFVVGEGNNISEEERNELWQRMVAEGHLIGLHTWVHNASPKIYASANSYLTQLSKLETAILTVTGVTPKVYRFPAGSNNAYCSVSEYKEITKEMTKKGYEYFDWNVDGQDAIGIHKTADSVANYVIKMAKMEATPVILLHDIPSCKGSVTAVSKIVDALTAAGYRFDTLDHLEQTVHQTIKGLT